MAVAPNGTAVVGWQRTYYQGAWVRALRPDGSLGPVTKAATGGMGTIALRGNGDGIVTSTNLDTKGSYRIIRVTRVVEGSCEAPARSLAAMTTPGTCGRRCCLTHGR